MTKQNIPPSVIAQHIAFYLGKPWKFNYLEASDWRFNIIDGSGRGLSLRVDGTRFKISGHFPRSKTSVYAHDYKTIGVSMHRPAQDIAADILRRLLPYYLEAYEKAFQQFQKTKAQEERVALMAEAIKKVSKGQSDNYNKSNRMVYFDQGEARICYNEEIDLKLRNLSIDQCIQIIALINGTHKDE